MQPSQQSAQRQMDQLRLNIQQDSIKTRLDADAIARMAKSNSGSSPSALQGKNPIKNLAKEGILVTAVEPNTQCARLGLKKGDILVSYDGDGIKNIQHLQDLIKLQPNAGRRVLFVVMRNNALLRFQVLPGRLGVSMREQIMAPNREQKVGNG